MSERRSHEYMTKEGRGVIHTKWATEKYRDGWERTFGKGGAKPKCDNCGHPHAPGSYCGHRGSGRHRLHFCVCSGS